MRQSEITNLGKYQGSVVQVMYGLKKSPTTIRGTLFYLTGEAIGIRDADGDERRIPLRGRGSLKRVMPYTAGSL